MQQLTEQEKTQAQSEIFTAVQQKIKETREQLENQYDANHLGYIKLMNQKKFFTGLSKPGSYNKLAARRAKNKIAKKSRQQNRTK